MALARTGNGLLDRCSNGSYKRLQPLLKSVDLKPNQVLYESRTAIEQVFFPLSCVTSSVTVMEDGAVIEVATVGREGAVGVPVLNGAPISPHRVFVQIAGKALTIDAKRLSDLARQDDQFRHVLGLYQQAFLFQVSQSVACNGLHVVSRRCCRWLLLTHDRVDGDMLALTHEFLAIMLGVRRATVSQVLRELQDRRLIESRHGQIQVLNRKGLEKAACECYRVATAEYDRLLGAGKAS